MTQTIASFIDGFLMDMNYRSFSLFQADQYVWYLYLHLILLIAAVWYLFPKIEKRDIRNIAYLFFSLLILSLIFYRTTGSVESSPMQVMALCIDDSAIHDVCSLGNFGSFDEAGMPLLLSLPLAFGINPYLAYYLSALLLSTVGIAFLYLLLRMYHPTTLSFLFTLLFISFPLSLKYLFITTKDLGFFALLLPALYFTLRPKEDWKGYLALAILLSFLVEVRIQGLIVAALAAVYLFMKSKGYSIDTLGKYLAFSIPFIITLPFKIYLLTLKITVMPDPSYGTAAYLGVAWHLLWSMAHYLAPLIAIVAFFSFSKTRKPALLIASYVLMMGFLLARLYADNHSQLEHHHLLALLPAVWILASLGIAGYAKSDSKSAILIVFIVLVPNGIVLADILARDYKDPWIGKPSLTEELTSRREALSLIPASESDIFFVREDWPYESYHHLFLNRQTRGFYDHFKLDLDCQFDPARDTVYLIGEANELRYHLSIIDCFKRRDCTADLAAKGKIQELSQDYIDLGNAIGRFAAQYELASMNQGTDLAIAMFQRYP